MRMKCGIFGTVAIFRNCHIFSLILCDIFCVTKFAYCAKLFSPNFRVTVAHAQYANFLCTGFAYEKC